MQILCFINDTLMSVHQCQRQLMEFISLALAHTLSIIQCLRLGLFIRIVDQQIQNSIYYGVFKYQGLTFHNVFCYLLLSTELILSPFLLRYGTLKSLGTNHGNCFPYLLRKSKLSAINTNSQLNKLDISIQQIVVSR